MGYNKGDEGYLLAVRVITGISGVYLIVRCNIMFTLYVGNNIRTKHFNKGEYIIYNDSFFNTVTCNIDLSLYAPMIKTVDNVNYSRGNRVRAKYGIVNVMLPITFLSTGCKTILNIMTNPNKIFALCECGTRVLNEIIRLEQGQGYLTAYANFHGKNIKVRVIDVDGKYQPQIFTTGVSLSAFLQDYMEG